MIEAEGGVAAPFVADVADEAGARSVTEEALRQFGRVDFLDNNVGVGARGSVVDTPVADWRRVMTVNVDSMFVSRHAIPAMIETAGGGAIVNVSSISALRPRGLTAYSASKGAVIALTRAMAVDHGPQNIRVNCVAPGPIYTPRMYTGQMTPAGREARRKASVLGLEGLGWDIGNAVRWLLSAQAKYITGQTLVVDGGASLVRAGARRNPAQRSRTRERRMDLFDLSGRVAIVTGGNGGIGLGMARGLAAAGAAVVIAARNHEKSLGAVAELGAKASFAALDVGDPASCRAVVAQTVERLGRVDILVNNAGMSIRKPPESYAVEEWQQVLNVNLTGAFVLCQAAYEPMKRQGGGKIINIGSMMSIFGGAYAAPYSSSKGGIDADDQVARHRLGQRQHPGQRGVAGLDRHRTDPECPRPGPGPQRAGPRPHPGRPLGRPRRSVGGRRRIPGRAGLRLRGDRRRHPGRRRPTHRNS